MPAPTQASNTSTNVSCESGGVLRQAPGVQARRTRGSPGGSNTSEKSAFSS